MDLTEMAGVAVLADQRDLSARLGARRAYERGRLVWASTRGAGAAGLAAVALYGCPQPNGAIVCTVALGVVVAAALWRGGAAGAGARAGFAAGLIPCLLPAAARVSGLCELGGPQILPMVCAAGGLIAGLMLGVRTAPDLPKPSRFWIVAGATALLAGGVGCLTVGVAGLMGLGIGMALGAAPLLVRRAAP